MGAKDQLENDRHSRFLDAVFRSLEDAILAVDLQMQVIEANEAIQRICGLIPGKMTGKGFVHAAFQCEGSCQKVIEETLMTKKTIKDFRVDCRHVDRPQQSVLVTSSSLLDRTNKAIGAVLVVRTLSGAADMVKKNSSVQQYHNIIGNTKPMLDMYKLLENLGHTDTTVLVTGESGTGKELVAEAIHYRSHRSTRPLIKINCSGLPESLLESELFGHVKGAFTGAIKDKDGRFQLANGGTVFLDEIGEISPTIRLKLLRVLEEKKFERVGDTASITVDVRLIAATNLDLREKVRLGEFREDLYYRVNVVEVALPPLRERLEDIPLLVDHFCKIFNKRFRKNIIGVSDEVSKILFHYHWPGNVRELKHAIEHAFVLCHGQSITANHLPSDVIKAVKFKNRSSAKPYKRDAQQILHALDKTDWNKAKAARMLGISRQTIYRHIERHKLTKL
jgi:transcriptional regulator with PAS, ATPase and Fis domain